MALSLQLKPILDILLVVVHIIVDKCLEFLLGWYLGPRKHISSTLTPDEEKIVLKSAVELAKLIREGKLTSYEVVKVFLERVKTLNPQINAVVDGPFPEALEQAKVIDARFAKGDISEQELIQKPFLGVPFTTKDSTAVATKLHTLGLISRKDKRAKDDAECIRLMKESGAIIIATSSVPEVNKWVETRNMLIGSTNNPYDLRRSCGGSSGGEAALITSCCTAFGLGTDIGGSIRIPAFNCGIFGHKTTKNVVNMRGCTFRTGNEKETMVVAGPMSKYATDLLPILKVIADPKMCDTLKLNEKVDIKKLNYFYIPCNDMPQCNPVNDETKMTMLKIRNHFKSLTGKEVKCIKLPGSEISGKMWRYWMTQEPANFSLLLGNGVKLNPFVELFKKLIGKSQFSMAAIFGLIDGILPQEKESFIKEATIKCKEALKEILGENGILFYHSSPRTAPFHYYPLVKFTDFYYFAIFNVLHVPVTQVPMGIDNNGMPLGIQVVANEMNDRLCLSVAKELERVFGGWVPSFPVKN